MTDTPVNRPELAVAVVCEQRVKKGGDNILAGISPIVMLPGKAGRERDTKITIYAEFVGNGFVGDLPLVVEYRDAAGNLLVTERETLQFQAGKMGAIFFRRPTVAVANAGLCWLEFLLDGALVTRIPILYLFEQGPNPTTIDTRTRDGDAWGPYVSIAAFAESYEGDAVRGTTLGARTYTYRIRGEDTQTGGAAPIPDVTFAFNPLAVFRIIPGKHSGERMLAATWIHPDGKEQVVRAESVTFQEPIRPFDWVFRQELDFPLAGTYELVLSVDGQRLASAKISIQHGFVQ